jgi:hypothetical protein
MPGNTPDQDTYVTVATPADMQELPVGTSTAESGYLCRKSVVDLYYRTSKKALRGQDSIQRRLLALADAIEAIAILETSVTAKYKWKTDEAS